MVAFQISSECDCVVHFLHKSIMLTFLTPVISVSYMLHCIESCVNFGVCARIAMVHVSYGIIEYYTDQLCECDVIWSTLGDWYTVACKSLS